ncbi:histidine phosphatase family protein [Bacillus pseudomycoides]|nr:histidine phosphatase family protein [Bacillus pseudomycoides]
MTVVCLVRHGETDWNVEGRDGCEVSTEQAIGFATMLGLKIKE